MSAKRTLVVTSITMALLEVVDAFFIEFPAAAVLFAGLFAAATFWYLRGSEIAAPVLLALLFAVEIAGVPFYPRTSVTDWIVQLGAVVISVAGLVSAIVVVARRGRPEPQPA